MNDVYILTLLIKKKGGAPLFGVSRLVPRFARVGAWDGSGALVRDGTVIDKVCDASKEMTMTVEIAVQDVEGARIAHEEGADRVELYTEPYATDYPKNPEAAIAPFIEAAKTARKLGIGLNAGHDLSLVNLNYFYKNIPWVDEVSIGHALISDALYLGLERTIQEYKKLFTLMNAMILLAQGAMNMADSLATANPVLTEVNAPE